MQEFMGTARNISFVEIDNEKLSPRAEVIIIVSEPIFRADDAGQMVRVRQSDTIRFSTGVEGLRHMAKEFGEWADAAERRLGELVSAGESGPAVEKDKDD